MQNSNTSGSRKNPFADLEARIEETKEEKNRVVKAQKFEDAARLRDNEKKLQDELEQAKEAWERKSDSEVHEVTA